MWVKCGCTLMVLSLNLCNVLYLVSTAPPSVELVARVRDLYHTRVSDVRFLIPVLNGLTKKEVTAALPKLIKLNPVVVKEVFNRFVFILHFKNCVNLHFLLIWRLSHIQGRIFQHRENYLKFEWFIQRTHTKHGPKQAPLEENVTSGAITVTFYLTFLFTYV